MKWISTEAQDAYLNFLRNNITTYYLTQDAVTGFADLADAAFATGPVVISPPSTMGGLRVQNVYCAPSIVLRDIPAVSLHLCLASDSAVLYITTVPALPAPVLAGETLNVAPFSMQSGGLE